MGYRKVQVTKFAPPPHPEPFLMQCLMAYPKCQIDRTLEWLKRNEFE